MCWHKAGALDVVKGTHGWHSPLLRTQNSVFEPLLGVPKGIGATVEAGDSRLRCGGVHPARVVFDLTELWLTGHLDDVWHIGGAELRVMGLTLLLVP